MSSVPSPEGFRLLAAGFLARRENPNTRDAYARDLAELGRGLGLGEEALPGAIEYETAFGVEDDPVAAAAAATFAGLSLAWFTTWRDALDGRPSTRRRRVAAARAFARWVSRSFAVANPAKDLRPPGGTTGQESITREMVALAPSAARRLCEAAAARPGLLGARDAALVEVLYGCGLRASEAAGLDISACHLDDTADPFVVVQGKGGKTRGVAVPATARGMLEAYLRVTRPRLRAGARSAPRLDADAVFLSTRGRRIGRAEVWRIVNAAAGRAGLLDDGARVFPHALRHSCGTHLIQAGVDIRFVQAHLGHASPVTTEVYTHVTAAHLRDDFDRAHPRARAGRIQDGPANKAESSSGRP